MEADQSRLLFLLFLLTWRLSPEVAAEVQESSGKRKKHLGDHMVKVLLGEGKGTWEASGYFSSKTFLGNGKWIKACVARWRKEKCCPSERNHKVESTLHMLVKQ